MNHRQKINYSDTYIHSSVPQLRPCALALLASFWLAFDYFLFWQIALLLLRSCVLAKMKYQIADLHKIYKYHLPHLHPSSVLLYLEGYLDKNQPVFLKRSSFLIFSISLFSNTFSCYPVQFIKKSGKSQPPFSIS